MDKLRLDMKAVDEVEPEVRELMETMTRMTLLPPEYDGKDKIGNWWVECLTFIV